ncbi:MAG: glycosyltransferase family 39 protein [Planctomycetaceae bacterium]
MRRSGIRMLVAALVFAGVAAAIAGCVSYERLQSAGALVRRAADFTPERFARFRQVCWFFAVALPGLAVWIWRRRDVETSRSSPTQLGASQILDSDTSWHVWIIVAVGFALRLQRWFDPVAYDEAYTYLNFASRPWYEAIGDYNSTNNHLLNTLLMHISTRMFGPQEWAMRWHVLLAGSLLPWAVFHWARDWFGRPAGLIAAAAVAVAPELITYSTDARGYILVALAAIVFDACWRGCAATSRRAWWFAWVALVAGLAAMPIMVYAAVGSARLVRDHTAHRATRRARSAESHSHIAGTWPVGAAGRGSLLRASLHFPRPDVPERSHHALRRTVERIRNIGSRLVRRL